MDQQGIVYGFKFIINLWIDENLLLGALVEVPLDLVALSVSGGEVDQGQQGQQD